MHDCSDLIDIFNNCFLIDYNTCLARGEDEPVYLPAGASRPHHTIYFAHGFFSSALHEVAHWLIAGEARRQLVDYGYWYAPDGRSSTEQLLFQQVEIKPQALEWTLSLAAGYPFQFSIDNLNGEEINTDEFKAQVKQQLLLYQQDGLSPRAERFRKALLQFYACFRKPADR